MKKKNFIKKTTTIALSLAILTSSVAFAHPGRTDSRGGHKDKKNVSGLGSYHYHCGDNPAHLHKNGVCPYKNASKAPAAPSNKLYARVPNFPVKISGQDINNARSEYPPLILNDVTYVPLTSDILNHLDLLYTWNNPVNLIINRKPDANPNKQFIQMFTNGTSWYGNTVEIARLNKGIEANGSAVSNQYPIITYKYINYLPLTTDILNLLGLKGGWTRATGFDLNLR